ncbi:MAG: CinA family protein [Butyribacter sp.]|nr:CinA family protein [bacterium]MDY3855186.1 CinA family protein [Butyribacter sp.]
MTAEEQLVSLLRKKGYHISTAESCTGGMIASSIVDISGASDVFEEGYVTYSNRVKEKLLGVLPDTIEQFTVVSAEVAAEMAAGTHRSTGAEITIAVTGYAGPADAEDGTKAGTVYIGTWYQNTVQTKKFVFSGDRNEVRRQAATQAIAFALERIQEVE